MTTSCKTAFCRASIFLCAEEIEHQAVSAWRSVKLWQSSSQCCTLFFQSQVFPPPFPRDGATKIFENDRVIVWDVAWLKQPYPFIVTSTITPAFITRTETALSYRIRGGVHRPLPLLGYFLFSPRCHAQRGRSQRDAAAGRVS
jgi:hypothetical protein